MPDWVLWMLAAAALAGGEVLTLGFFLGPLAVAAVAAAVVAAVGAGPEIQFAVFIVGAIASVAILRPIARRHLKTPPQIRTGTAALVGAPALVTERVDANGGQVRLHGEIWSARSYDEDQVFQPGAKVEVMKIEGATALVSE
jgi:membrane protein implicated in regulation of membrane protease activity